MKRANRLLLIAGVVLAVVSFVAVLAFGSFGQPQQPAAVTEIPVVVAAANLNLGTALTPEMLTTVNREPADAVDTFQHPEDLVGRVVRHPVSQGAALTNGDFETVSGLPEVAGSVASGLRAIALPLSRVDSVGALLQPGDWVDALMTLEDTDGTNPMVLPNPGGFHVGTDGSISPPYFTIDDFMNNTTVKVVVQNVQVLAALAGCRPERQHRREHGSHPARRDRRARSLPPAVRGHPLRAAGRTRLARPPLPSRFSGRAGDDNRHHAG